MITKILKFIEPLSLLLYPNLCLGCAGHEPVYHGLFCHYCWNEIPRFSDLNHNRKILENKFPLIFTEYSKFYGLFLFSKKGIVQKIAHKIKYEGKGHMAQKLGEFLGKQIPPNVYDALIPVPMHPKKQRKRGYNQAEKLAKGIKTSTGIKIITNALQKIQDTESQTQKNRARRYSNVLQSYKAKKPLPTTVKNVLLVDDIITTGATLEVCTHLLERKQKVSVDYAFLAMTV